MLQGLGSDLRYTLKVLARSRGFTLVAVLSLALGLGANTAMLGVVRTLLLEPIPVRAPEELFLASWRRDGEFRVSQSGTTSYSDPATGARYRSNFTWAQYQAFRDAPEGASLFAFSFLGRVSVALGDAPAHLAGATLADGHYFSVLGPEMALGRPLGEADDVPGAPLVVVLSHAFWMSAFGGDPAIVGRTVRISGNPAEVVGVTGEGFQGLSRGGFFPRTEITAPLSAQPLIFSRVSADLSLFTDERQFWLRVMARLPGGASVEAVGRAFSASMNVVPSPLILDDGFQAEVRLLPGAQGAQPVGPETARLLWFMMGVVGAVLLIACLNLASLMLSRGVARQRELAVRRALGGGRARLARQVLLECLVLAGAGTAAGLTLALLGRELLVELVAGSLGPVSFGREGLAVAFDPWVFSMSAGLGLLATLVFGLLPALRLSAVDPAEWLGRRGDSGVGTPRLSVGRALIALQVAASVPLVVGAVLFLRTVSGLGAVELGFDPSGLAMFRVDPGFTRHPPEDNPLLYGEVLARIGEIPGVRSATLIENPLLSGVVSNSNVTADGVDHLLYRNAIGPAALETLGMRLVEGRVPGLQDDRSTGDVGAVNETAVREMFGGASPVGRALTLGGRKVQIVGVVGDTPYRDRREPVPPTLYPSALQWDGYGGHTMVVRTDVPLAGLEPLVREVVRRVDPDLPVPALRSQTAVISETSARERVFTQLLTVFGAFALLLASVGLYGVTSYAVSRRSGEIGVRMAVGARPEQVLWLVLRQVLVLAGVGVALGAPLSLAVAPVAGSLLYGVAPGDPSTLIAASASLLLVALAAGLVPALRAARLAPTASLRGE